MVIMQTSSRIKLASWLTATSIALLLIVLLMKGNLFHLTPASEQAALTSLESKTPIRFKVNETGHVVDLSATDSTMNDTLAIYLKELPALQRLHLERSGISDAALQHVTGLKNLEALFLDETEVTDTGMLQLEQSDQLRTLSLAQCKVGDAGLLPLSRLVELKLLNLNQTDVTDAGLKHLEPLKKMESLYASETELTGPGLQSLGELPQLTHLDLSGIQVDAALIESLRQFPNLELLYLGNSTIDDQLIASLMTALTEATPKLRALSLKETPLSDSAIPSLKSLQQLKHLAIVQLQGTRITKPAFKELASAVTEVNFSVNYSERDD
ncbi:MAG TPA: hypothetical protein DDZ90_13920 [Planctomycetaceae bacterium]|nr:hypothetical protein [Planctomycetaceae bacterium]